MATLTKRQKQIYDFICSFSKKRGFSPTVREIAKHFRLSPPTIQEHKIKLVEKGLLNKDSDSPRGIELNAPSTMVQIPLLGTITAGQPIEAIETPGETIAISKNELGKHGQYYALKVQGNSMVNDGIFDGDIVVLREQKTADNGQTVVAIIDNNQATLKKIYKEKKWIRLQPANQAMLPIYRKEMEIRGVVVKIIRNLEESEEKIQNNEAFTNATMKYMQETDIKHRKSLGQYFTPKLIREALIKQLPNNTRNPRVLDPACGTGEFLLTAKEYFKNPQINGWDIDKKLINISEKLLPQGNFKNIDALLDENYEKYDFIIGNPPYFEFSPSEKIKQKFIEVINGRTNIFNLFIYQGIRWLKPGGHLAFVVPPSMNNGAYFAKLRTFIIKNTNIEYLKILDDPKLFNGALQSTMLIVLKTSQNKGNYILNKSGISIFSENPDLLKKAFNKNKTLHDLGYKVRTGRLVWNQNRHNLTNNHQQGVPLIWAHNITDIGLRMPIVIEKKPQYVRTSNFDIGPAIVVNRITGSVKSSKLKAAIIPSGMKFIAENHVNVIFPPHKQGGPAISRIAEQLCSKEKVGVLKNITGNTQISKTELEKLFPISINL